MDAGDFLAMCVDLDNLNLEPDTNMDVDRSFVDLQDIHVDLSHLDMGHHHALPESPPLFSAMNIDLEYLNFDIHSMEPGVGGNGDSPPLRTPSPVISEGGDYNYRPEPRLPLPGADPSIELMEMPDMQRMALLTLSHPLRWSSVLEELPTLKPRQYVASVCINYHLLQIWIDNPQWRSMVYMDHQLLERISNSPNVEQENVNFFRLAYPENLEMKPVIFLVYQHQHYFVVVFDYLHRLVVVFGESLKEGGDNKEWKEWGGPRYWDQIAVMLGWEVQSARRYLSSNWMQNGVDCGPDAVAVAENLISRGIQLNRANHLVRLQLPKCRHQIRQDIFYSCTHKLTAHYTGWNIYRVLLQPIFQAHPMDIHLHTLRTGLIGSRTMMQVQNTLHHEALLCCRGVGLISARLVPQMAGDLGPDNNPLGADPTGDQVEEAHDGKPEVDEEGGEAEGPSNEALTEKQKRIKRTFQAIRRLRLPTKAISQKGLSIPIPIDSIPKPAPYPPTFVDQHNTGPSVEEARDMRPDGPILAYDIFGTYLAENAATMFRDWGYRLEPDFALMFFNIPPVMGIDHILSMPDADDLLPEPSAMASAIEFSDSYTIGMQHMLDRTVEGSPASVDYFVSGILPPDEGREHGLDTYLRVDPELDAVTVDPEEVQIDLDIDSIIWVTPTLVTKGTIQVHVLPSTSSHPPLAKHNHMYVHVLIPRSQADKDNLGPRREWWSKQVAISSIPNLHFAQIGKGTGSLNCYVLFPRMMHRQLVKPFFATLMPQYFQELWFNEVLIPALLRVYQNHGEEYSRFSVDEWKDKLFMGKDGRAQKTQSKTLPLGHHLLVEMQVAMREIVADQPELQDFGGFFFVMDGRGMKLETMTGLSGYDDPWDALTSEYPGLDWDYMLDRDNGELVLDVGLGFHAHKEGIPLTGLWRLAPMLQSYECAGMKAPRQHYANTHVEYGALQAEMRKDRRQVTHQVFRSTYNLCFEVVRRPGAEVLMCDDADAYHGNNTYSTACDQYAAMYASAVTKDFGVREEYRISGVLARDVLTQLVDKARHFLLLMHPILWLPSSTWWQFSVRRLRVIEAVQMSLVRSNPPNLGTLTILLMHLMRAICTTPKFIPPSLLDSRQRMGDRVTQRGRFGLLFIHGLDLESATVEDFDPVDSDAVRQHVKADAKQLRKHPALALPTIHSAEDYPIGAYPTWRQLKAVIVQDATRIMVPWAWNPSWQQLSGPASNCFIAFTKDYMLTVSPAYLVGGRPPAITTLSEAMGWWAVSSLKRHILDAAFLPSNAGLEGPKRGADQLLFREQMDVFFPSRDVTDQSVWKPFVIAGYIGEYHRLLDELDEGDGITMKHALSILFSKVQALPNARGSNHKDQGSLWITDASARGCPTFVTNPSMYRILGLGSEVENKVKEKHLPRSRVTVMRPALLQLLFQHNRGYNKHAAKKAANSILKGGSASNRKDKKAHRKGRH